MAGPRWRVIVDNDYAGDPDGLLALAHHFLADAGTVRAVTCTSIAMEGMPYPDGSPARAAAEELIRRFGVTDPVGTYARHPSPRPLTLFDTIDTRLMFGDFFARLALRLAGGRS